MVLHLLRNSFSKSIVGCFAFPPKTCIHDLLVHNKPNYPQHSVGIKQLVIVACESVVDWAVLLIWVWSLIYLAVSHAWGLSPDGCLTQWCSACSLVLQQARLTCFRGRAGFVEWSIVRPLEAQAQKGTMSHLLHNNAQSKSQVSPDSKGGRIIPTCCWKELQSHTAKVSA